MAEERSKGKEGSAIVYCPMKAKKESANKLIKRITSYSPIRIGNRTWSITVNIPYSELTGPLHKHARNTFGLAGIVILLFGAGGVAFFRVQKKKAELETEAKYLKQLVSGAMALKKSEEKLAGIVSSVTDHMSMVDEKFNIVWTNDVAKGLFGPDIVGKKCYAAYKGRNKACESCAAKSCFEDGKTHHHEVKIVRADGNQKIYWCTASVAAWHEDGRPRMVVEFLRDITDREQREEQLRQYTAALEEARSNLEQKVEERTRELKETQKALVRNERLAALGQLAGSVGHELRNPLGIIKNAGYFLNMKIDTFKNDAVKENIDIINKETNIAAKIISDLLDFARIKEPERREVDINQLITDTLSRSLKMERITVTKNFADNIPPVSIDPLQVSQVFLNLIENAGQAMEKGGTLKISTRVIDGATEAVFADEGRGIPKNDLDKIFEPLFTTKTRGIGLGLSVSKSLAKANGANILVESEEGKGSRFVVRFGGEEVGKVDREI